MKPIITKLAGVTFGDAQKNIKLFGCKDINSYALVREPNNPHDPNAIRVALFRRLFLGYVSEGNCKRVGSRNGCREEVSRLFCEAQRTSSTQMGWD